jgi:hypothetical protein
MGDTMTEDKFTSPAEMELRLVALVSDRYTGKVAGAEVDAKIEELADRLVAWRADLARQLPRCPQCTSLAYRVEQEPWGDRSTCKACGLDRFDSIGD